MIMVLLLYFSWNSFFVFCQLNLLVIVMEAAGIWCWSCQNEDTLNRNHRSTGVMLIMVWFISVPKNSQVATTYIEYKVITFIYLWLSCKNCNCCFKFVASLCQNCIQERENGYSLHYMYRLLRFFQFVLFRGVEFT